MLFRSPTTPEQPDWMENVLGVLSGGPSKRWILVAAPILSGRNLPANPLPVAKIKTLAGGSTWRGVPASVNHNYLESFGCLRVDGDSELTDFVLSQRRKPERQKELNPLPAIPMAYGPSNPAPARPEAEPKLTRKNAREDRRKDKTKAIQRGLDQILASDGYTPKEKLQFEEIADSLDRPRSETAQRLGISLATVTNRLAVLKKLGDKAA